MAAAVAAAKAVAAAAKAVAAAVAAAMATVAVVQALMKDCIAPLTGCCCSYTLPSITQTSSSSKRSANPVAVSMDET
eukprot:scaffold24876_cov45-Phaeocystis_antarctica.AAC.1